MDGEIVTLDEKNHSNFEMLQNSIKGTRNHPIFYYIFDLLYVGKWDITSLTLLERKTLLKPLLTELTPSLHYSDHIQGEDEHTFKAACKLGLEGIVSKRIDSQYIAKRTKSWLKIKCHKRQEFVVGGFSPPKGGRSYFGALYLGLYNKNGELDFTGSVGTGFNAASLALIYQKLQKIISNKNPFTSIPPGSTSAQWVKPQLVVEVEFTEFTQEGRARHPSFKGLRTDKKPTFRSRITK